MLRADEVTLLLLLLSLLFSVCVLAMQFAHSVEMLDGGVNSSTTDFVSLADGAGAGKSRLISELPGSLPEALKGKRWSGAKLAHQVDVTLPVPVMLIIYINIVEVAKECAHMQVVSYSEQKSCLK